MTLGYDQLVVYADREHSANLAYLTGFDPRFEEAMLVVNTTGEPAILVGNECYGMAGAAPVEMRRALFQDFSLPGQPRDRSRPLAEILAAEGIRDGSRVGVIGWKEYADRETIEVPAFIVDELRRMTPAGSVANAAHLLIGAADGLRVINEVEQLAAFEYAACRTSRGVRQLLFGLEPGMREDDAVALLGWNGMPLSCHLMLSSGDRATLGLLSPSDRRIERGDRFTVAFGIWGALNCRAGFVVDDAAELPAEIGDYVDRLVAPYFEAVAEWYGALRIGQTGGALHEIISRHLGDPFFGIFLNPGHQIHLDEWVNSPVAPGSRSSCAPAWRCRSTSSPRPAPSTSRRTSRTASRSPTRRCAPRSPSGTRTHGLASRSADDSWRTRSGSSCIPTCCRSPTSPRGCRRSCSAPIAR